jgi:PLD-like domain
MRLEAAGKPLTVFRAELSGREEAGWEDLFAGFTALKAITFSSSIELLLRLSERLDDMEVVFGSESILSKEHLALAQASTTIEAYGFPDALIDHKALVEALSRLLGRAGKQLLERVAAGSLRFRLLRGRPSHEKLYLLSGPSGSRVLTGSANLGRAAFEGWQHEILIVFDGEPAWRLFEGYYERDWKDSVPVAAECLVIAETDGRLAARDARPPIEEVPIVRALSAGIALIDPPARPSPAGFAAEALREASALGAQLKDLALPKDKAGRTLVNAGAVLRVIRSHRARPVGEASEDGIPRGEMTSRPGSCISTAPAG